METNCRHTSIHYSVKSSQHPIKQNSHAFYKWTPCRHTNVHHLDKVICIIQIDSLEIMTDLNCKGTVNCIRLLLNMLYSVYQPFVAASR